MRTTLRKLTVARLLVIFLLLPALTSAETAVQVWVQSYSRGYGNDTARAIAVDGNNNVIVTGFSWGGGTSSDYATIKYSSAGVVLWTKLYNYGGFDYANAVAVDGNNDVIVTGQSTGSDGHTLDYATIKYSSAGIPLWTNRYNELGNGNAVAKSVTVDGNNDVIVTGIVTIKYSSTGVPLWTNHYGAYFFNSARAVAVVISNNVIVTGNSSSISSADYATIKYSSAGVPLWTNRYDGSRNGYDDAMAVAVDSSDNVIVTGSSTGSGSGNDYATIKYSGDGVPLWTNRYNGPGNNSDSASAVVVDRSGNVIVTGTSTGNGSSSDYATIKYSGDGVPLWTNRYDGPGNNSDSASAVVVDRTGNVIVTGSSGGSPYDCATIKYSSAGLPLWTNRFDDLVGGDDEANAVAVDRDGNVIVTGTCGAMLTIKYTCGSWPAMTCIPTNGTFQMRVDNVLQPGTLVIEASTNLTGWSPVFTNTTPTNVLFYTEPDAGNSPARFYRAFEFP